MLLSSFIPHFLVSHFLLEHNLTLWSHNLGVSAQPNSVLTVTIGSTDRTLDWETPEPAVRVGSDLGPVSKFSSLSFIIYKRSRGGKGNELRVSKVPSISKLDAFVKTSRCFCVLGPARCRLEL